MSESKEKPRLLKIFRSREDEEQNLEEEVNEFLENPKISVIEIQCTSVPTLWTTQAPGIYNLGRGETVIYGSNSIIHTVFIFYRETK